MALETGTLIPELDGSNPPGSDPKSQGDNHLRLIKQCVLGSFPAFVGTTAVPASVSKTEDEINDLTEKTARQVISGPWVLANAAPLYGRNAADDADVQILDFNATGIVQVGSVDPEVAGVLLDATDIITHRIANDSILNILPAVDGGATISDRDTNDRLVGFRNPSLLTIAGAYTPLQADEGRVMQTTAGAQLTLDALEQGTSLRFVTRGASTGNSITAGGATITHLQGSSGGGGPFDIEANSIVELYYATTTLVFMFGNGINA